MKRKLSHKLSPKHAKRGDTIIEVMIAVAIFALLSVLAIAMMNNGVAIAERALETVVARNEINAQVEALRYIHDSYVMESTLPTCDNVAGTGQKCQQFLNLWNTITQNAIEPDDYTRYMPQPLTNCNELYQNNNELLDENHLHAFVLNTRVLQFANNRVPGTGRNPYIYGTATLNNGGTSTPIFQPPILGARIVFTSSHDSNLSSEDDMQTITPSDYDRVARVDGLWVVAVKERRNSPRYYDFYVGACWYGSGTNAPTTLDTVIRLYNPEGANHD